MSGFANWFTWATTSSTTELEESFPLQVPQNEFIKNDTLNIYARILTDVVERTQGVKDELQTLLWDNCLKSESNDGLITTLSRAMAEKKDLYLVYEKALNLLRKATPAEQEKIRVDYEKSNKSATGVYISFQKYIRTDMVNLYGALEYCTVGALNKSMNLAKAIQFKMSDLRGSVALVDSSKAEAQARVISRSLGCGRDVLMDAKDVIEHSTPDLTATKESMLFISQKRSFYLGMPSSYITGDQPETLGDSGEGDAKAVERGLKSYYFSIMKPVLEALFDIKTTFKSQDFRMIAQALEALKTFELTSGALISEDNKRLIINKLLGLPENEKGDEEQVTNNEQQRIDSEKQSENVPRGTPKAV